MIIEINNLGYVKNVKVNLNKDLIVLCGPNNTGKTYVAYAIYGLMKHRHIESQIRSFSKAVELLPEKGEIEIDLVKTLKLKGSEHLKRVTSALKNFLPNVFAAPKAIFDKTEIIGRLNDISTFEKKIINSEIVRQVGFAGQLSARLLKPKGSSILKCVLIKNQNGDNEDSDIPLSLVIEIITERIQNIYLDSWSSHHEYLFQLFSPFPEQ